MARFVAALVVALAFTGCGSKDDGFKCIACAVNSDCNAGFNCHEGYCVRPGDDPSRCPKVGSASGSSGSASSSASSVASSSGTASASSSTGSTSSASASSSSGTVGTSSSGSSGSSSAASTTSSASSTGSSTGTSSGSTTGSSSGSSASSGSSSGSSSSGSSTGDTCAAPTVLTLGNTVVDDTTNASDDFHGPCSSAAELGPDLVFAFTATETRSYALGTAWLSGLPPYSTAPQTYALTDCDPNSANLCALYDDTGLERGIPMTQGETIYIVVDSDGGAGRFALSVTTPASNDDCSSPTVFTLAPDGGPTTVPGTLYGTGDNYYPACTTENGIDVVFEFDAPTAQRYRFTVTPDVTLDPAIALGSSCGDSSEGCSDSTGFGTPEVLVPSQPLAVGPHFLVVDGSHNGKGNFTLTAEGLGP